jgi:biopolymer transport protein ExbB
MNAAFFEKILKSWTDGGWTMVLIGLVALVIYTTGAHLLCYLSARGHKKITDRQINDWIKHPERSEGEVGDIIRYTQDNVEDLDAIANRFAEVNAGKVPEVDRRLTTMNILVSAAPLLGLLGTVLGMIMTFQGISTGGGKMADAIAQGISAALITTEMGLLVALPGMVLSYLVRRQRNEYVAFLAKLESITLRYFRREKEYHGITRVFVKKDCQGQKPGSGSESGPARRDVGLSSVSA